MKTKRSRLTLENSRVYPLFGLEHNWKRAALAGALVAAVLVPIGCTKRSSQQVLARVGPAEITVEQFREHMVRRGGGRPETLDKQALLQEMIEQEALYVRALMDGLDKDPELQRVWRNLLVSKLKERELAPRLAKVGVTEAEVKAGYEANGARYMRPEAVRLAVLYLKTEPVTKPEQIAELQAKMSAARQKALTGEPGGASGFGALAISCSEDQATRYSGGIVGWVEKNRGPKLLGPLPTEAGFALKHQGDLSEVITDSKGIYLLKLLERRDAAVTPLVQVEPSLRQSLLTDKRRAVERDFIRQSRQAVPVQTHPELLVRIPLPAGGTVADGKQPPAFP